MMKRAIDYRALAEFRYEIRRFLTFSERAAQAAGIEPQQHQALLAIKGLPAGIETTVGALAERLQIRHHTAVELTDRLEKNGWIHRSRGQDDARKVNLHLTRRGEQLLERLSVSHRNELGDAGPRLLVVLHAVLAHDHRRPGAKAQAGAGRGSK